MIVSKRWARQLWKFGLALLLTAVVVTVAQLKYHDQVSELLPNLGLDLDDLKDAMAHHGKDIITDVRVGTCYFGSGCQVPDANWTRVEKDIYLGRKWLRHGYLMYKKSDSVKPGDRVVVSVLLSDSVPAAMGNATDDKAQSLRWSQLHENLWIARDYYEGKASDKVAVTGLNLLFGDDAVEPRTQWTLSEKSIRGSTARVSVRSGPIVAEQELPAKPALYLSSGKFKILQIADLHYSTGYGECLDQYPGFDALCKADPKSTAFVERLLDLEKPDLAVLTGDQIFGGTSPDSETALLKVLAPLIKRQIPYAFVFGNHDSQGSLTREEQMAIAQTLPYNIAEAGPQDIDGVGNYIVKVRDQKSNHVALAFYMIDSHGDKVGGGYEAISANQLRWLKSSHAEVKEEQSKFSKIPLSMAFWHIPLPEYRNDAVKVGERRESVAAGSPNTGAFSLLQEISVPVLSVGHDHVNDYCTLQGEGEQKVWLCYGGGIGFGAYGGHGGYIRRSRVYELDTASGQISTRKIRYDDSDGALDSQVLVDGGRVKGI